MTSIEEIKRHCDEMARYPYNNPMYAFAVSDCRYLISEIERLKTTIDLGNKSEDNKDKIIESIHEENQNLQSENEQLKKSNKGRLENWLNEKQENEKLQSENEKLRKLIEKAKIIRTCWIMKGTGHILEDNENAEYQIKEFNKLLAELEGGV